MVIEISNKEGENDVNGKEGIDDVVYDEQCVLLLREKGKLKWANPCRVNNKDNQQHLPCPATIPCEKKKETPPQLHFESCSIHRLKIRPIYNV